MIGDKEDREREKRLICEAFVDVEGEVLDMLLQAKRDTKAARKPMRKLLKRQGVVSERGSQSSTGWDRGDKGDCKGKEPNRV